jgi:WD40 repeat protein
MSVSIFINTLFPKVIANLIVEYSSFAAVCQLVLETNSKMFTNSHRFGNTVVRSSYNILPDGRIITFDNNEQAIKIWNIEQQHYHDSEFTLHCNNYHRNSHTLYFSSPNHYVRVCSVLSNGTLLTSSSNGKLTIHNQTEICDWDSSNLSNLNGASEWRVNHYCQADRCSILSDGRIITATDGVIQIWNIKKNKCIVIFRVCCSETQYCSHIICIIGLPDGRIACGLSDGTLKIFKKRIRKSKILKLWNRETEIWECELSLKEHSKHILCCTILPNEQYFHIVTGSSDGTLKIWDISQYGKCIMTLKGHKNQVSCCSILYDGRIISGSKDQTLKIWNTKNGNCELTLKAHSSEIIYCVASTDGRIISGSKDRIIIWT